MNNNSFNIFTIIICLFISISANALVDYSGGGSSFKSRKGAKSRNVRNVSKIKSKIEKKNSSKSAFAKEKSFFFSGKYENVSLKSEEYNTDVNLYELAARIQTPVNLFIDLSYLNVSSDFHGLAKSTTSMQDSNVTALLGINWLKLGTLSDLASINLLGGVSFSPNQSDYGSERVDKIFGVQTSKRFFNFFLDLGYQLTLTADSEDNSEVDIGNIQKIYGALAWIVSVDIAFQIEGATYSVMEGDSKVNSDYLVTKNTFGYVSPKLNLGLAPMVELELGAVFRTSKAKDLNKLVRAKMWNIKGIYGDSLYSSLIVSF